MSNSNEPAFPATDQVRGEEQRFTGLTIREHFAAKAMEGLLANPELESRITSAWAADEAVKYADALIRRLNQ